jgi:uncharacterized protein
MTLSTNAAVATDDRFPRLEDPGSDFPFYNGAPVTISGRQWLFVIGMVALAFVLLAPPVPWPPGAFWQFVPAVLLPALPLFALAQVAPGHWRSIFGRVRGREVRLMIGYGLLNIIVSMSVGAIVQALTELAPNAATAQLGSLDVTGRLLFFAKTLPQLFGEEVITLLPFLALLYWLSAVRGLGRKAAIVVAWLVSSLVFGLIHLPTYDWNLVQCVVIIGSARLVLTLPWILTKNIWVSTGAHIFNDWLLFSMGLLGAALAGKA